jgi:hypothetical protein
LKFVETDINRSTIPRRDEDVDFVKNARLILSGDCVIIQAEDSKRFKVCESVFGLCLTSEPIVLTVNDDQNRVICFMDESVTRLFHLGLNLRGAKDFLEIRCVLVLIEN